MALFNDGPISSLQDVTRYESALLNVCAVEQIDLNEKLALAQDLIGADLLLYLLQLGSSYPLALPGSGDSASARRALGVTDVVVTDPLHRWHTLKSIELTYGDAYSNQLNDRYQAKWRQYRQLALAAYIKLRKTGVGLSQDPVPKAAAPLLLSIAGQQPAQTLYVEISWLNKEGQEGAPSDLVALTIANNSRLVVNPGPSPSNVTGWNVYAGPTPSGLALQSAALTAGVDWAMPGSGLAAGQPPGQGQSPDRYIVDHQVLQRG